MVPVIQAILDVAMSLLAAFLAYEFRFYSFGRLLPIRGNDIPDPGAYAAAAPVAAFVVFACFLLVGVYRPRRGVLFIDELLSIVWGMALATLVGFALIGLNPVVGSGSPQHFFSYSRVTFAYWAVIATILIAFARYGLRRYQVSRTARGVGLDRAIVVGWGDGADLLVRRIQMFPDYGYRLIGVLADIDLDVTQDVGGVEVIGAISGLEDVVQQQRIDTVFLALPDHIAADLTLRLVERCRRTGVDFRILPSLLQLMSTQVSADQIDGIPLIQYRAGLEISGAKTVAKRVLDLILSVPGLVLVSPVLALIAILVKTTSPGPILIHQERVGKDGRPFLQHKFRGMRADAEAHTGPVWASADDPRRTWVGKWIRRFSLDELPQLWNIINGEMSLVGPRGERPHFVEQFAQELPRYEDRHTVRPGLTGWAQANDLRGQTPVEERLIYDLYYIENWSLAFDVKIILLTLARVWTHKNAY